MADGIQLLIRRAQGGPFLKNEPGFGLAKRHVQRLAAQNLIKALQRVIVLSCKAVDASHHRAVDAVQIQRDDAAVRLRIGIDKDFDVFINSHALQRAHFAIAGNSALGGQLIQHLRDIGQLLLRLVARVAQHLAGIVHLLLIEILVKLEFIVYAQKYR